MAKQKDFFAKLIQKLKREAGASWTRNFIGNSRNLAAELEGDEGEWDLIGYEFFGSLQQEARVRRIDEAALLERDPDADVPLIYPGFMAAWEQAPVTVDFDREGLVEPLRDSARRMALERAALETGEGAEAQGEGEGAREGEGVREGQAAAEGDGEGQPETGLEDKPAPAPGDPAQDAPEKATEAYDNAVPLLLQPSAEQVRSLFPSCMMFDVRDFKLKLYGTTIDALVAYPSYDADRDYGVLPLLGINYKQGLRYPFESKLVLVGDTLADMMDYSIEERERLRGRCLAGLDAGLHEDIFPPYDDEEVVLVLFSILVGVMLWDGTCVELSERRGIPHLHVREAEDEEEGSIDLSFVGMSMQEGSSEKARQLAEAALAMSQEQDAARAAEEAAAKAKAEARARAQEKARIRAEKRAAREAQEKAEAERREAAKREAAERATRRKAEEAARLEAAEREREEAARRAAEAEEAAAAAEREAEEAAELARMEAAEREWLEAQEREAAERTAVAGEAAAAAERTTTSATAGGAERTAEAGGAATEQAAEAVEIAPKATAVSEAAPRSAAAEHVPDYEEALFELELLKERLAAEEAKASTMEFHLKQARASAEELRRTSAGLKARAALVESLELPETPAEALALAERAFPDRLIVLPQARKSAEDFRKGMPGEVWAVLRSLATTLHPLVFGRGGGSITHAFEAQTGFELTLREMKLIKKTDQFSRLRTVHYRGEDHDASAHVKGRKTKKGEALRVHFFADYDEAKIVVTHCGEHLTTYDTSSL